MADYELIVRAQRAWVDDARWQPAAVAVNGGVIAGILPYDTEATAVDDVALPATQVLIPGLIDSHVHVNEPGRTEWEGFTSATRAAAAGGVTTIVDMPLNSIPPTTTPEGLAVKRAAAQPQLTVDVGFWGGAIPSSLGSLSALHAEGVYGFKCFLSPSGVDEFPHLDRAQLRAALEEVASLDALLIVHAEDPAVLDAHAHPGGTHYPDFVASRPEEAEQDAIAAVIDGVRATGARAHILHLSSARALGLIRAAKAEGLPVTVETCPHYLSFASEQIPDGATEYKCCPPIRDEGNRELLWDALLAGDIDIIASDHSPSTAELKFAGHGDFGVAWGGISGLQLSFPAVWTGARARGIPLERVLGWMASGTAGFLGLEDKGSIALDRRADLVAFAPEEEFTVLAAELEHKNKVSAFDGLTLAGVVHRSWLGGRAVHELGASADHAGTGRMLRRG